jgi:large subunit ribosomal protein L4
MTSVQLKDLKGKAVGEVSFDDSIFGLEPNVHVMHAALHRQLANGRAGTASTLTRAEVRGGGRKPWRQKGTGRARAGTIRSPLWNGGGVIFGPKPRDYSQSLPKKVRQLALRSALAARKEEFVVVQNFDGLFDKAPKSGDDSAKIEQPKTKKFVAALKDLGVTEKRVLLLLDNGVPGVKQIERAARNICGVRVLCVTNLNVKDIMEAEVVLTSERTIELINQRFKPGAKSTAEQPQKAAKAKKTGEAKEASAEKAAPKKAAKAAEPKAEKAKTTKTKAEGAEKPAAKKAKKSEE